MDGAIVTGMPLFVVCMFREEAFLHETKIDVVSQPRSAVTEYTVVVPYPPTISSFTCAQHAKPYPAARAESVFTT